MRVEQIWIDNPLRNFNYLIACEETGEALALDPLDHARCLAIAKERGWTITQILNTHEHHDHIGGNPEVKRATGATIAAHANAKDTIPEMDRGLEAGDIVRVGKTVILECMDTPGHTMSHVCLRSRGDHPALFCGDTLFNAGVGNCHNGGDPEVLYSTFAEQISELPDETIVYPGHDYIQNNLRFTLDREPDNERAKHLLDSLEPHDPSDPLTTTLALEKETNTFLRLRSPSVIAALREAFPDLPTHPDPKTVFVSLRKLRDRW